MRKFVSLMIVSVMLLATLTLGVNAANTSVKADVKIDVSKIEKIESDCSIKIIYPVLSGFNSASKLNDMIQNENINSIDYIRDAWSALQQMKEEQKEAGQDISYLEVALDTNFDYSLSGDVLSVMMNSYSYTGGAHGMYYIDSFTVNTKTDEVYTFNSLFEQDSNYKKVVVDKINNMIDKEKDSYFEDAKKTVADMDTDFKFYIDGSNLVIYFNLYELRCYAAGMSKFTIAAMDLKGLLKDEVYSQIINAKPLANTRLNGISLASPYKTYVNDYTLMVPLRFFAETLGYKVGWDSKKGASVAGGYIKNNVNLYYTSETQKTPRKLSPAKIVKNVLYVPIAYFSEILNEDVTYDGEVARLFKYTSQDQSQFNNQIVEFRYPSTAEQCVQMYAQAVKERKGAIQYALYSEKLRTDTKSNFQDLNWVTGVSSPWVTGFDIYENKDAGKDAYNIIFHWATSTGKSPDSKTIVTLENISEQEYWQITSIQE